MSAEPQRKPVENEDYYCGTCAGHRAIYCPDCVVGCVLCRQKGTIRCPTCVGGLVPQPPPDWDR